MTPWILQERYQSGDSLIHRFDPRMKIVVTLLLIVGIVLTPGRAWPAYPLLWALIGALAMVARLSIHSLARRGSVALFFALAAITLPFTMPGESIHLVFGVTVSEEGLARFVAIILKSWLAVQVAFMLAMTTPFSDLLIALRSLRVPQIMIAIISFMYRYLFTLKDEAERLMRARAARSGSNRTRKSGGNLIWRARVTGGMIGNLFLRSYERSERVYAAMLARGYDGQMRTFDSLPLRWSLIWPGILPLAALAVIELLAVMWWS